MTDNKLKKAQVLHEHLERLTDQTAIVHSMLSVLETDADQVKEFSIDFDIHKKVDDNDSSPAKLCTNLDRCLAPDKIKVLLSYKILDDHDIATINAYRVSILRSQFEMLKMIKIKVKEAYDEL